jgi:tetratricopeptide (TPR) repeat protein
MALSSLAAHLAASGFGSLTASMKRKKLEKKINANEIELDDLLWLSGYYLNKKDYFKAESFALKASEIKSKDNSVLNTLFTIYYHKADYKKAIEIVESLIENGKDLAIHYFNLGYCYFKMGEIEQATENKKKAEELDLSFRREKYK